ncbi:MAG TPA: adenylate/guanylate cyclase domain-containing protein, partial [Acidimicrobiia bacterium]|nr:adenylate/guanylate cyclase domain-containing protein [Acidimicrobiia bacterium]
MTSLPTGTVTFLFTDVEGSTRLWDTNSELMAAAVAVHDRLIRGVVLDHGGHVFSTAGDSFAVAFAHPGNGVAAALDAQLRLAREEWPGGLPIKVRMALHSGTASEREGDYFGPAPNRCARLLTLAAGGQVLLTEATHGMVKDQPPAGVSFRDHGSHRLRDLSATERVFAMVHQGLDAPSDLVRSLDAHPNNLPGQVTSFVGRSEELEEAIKLTKGSRQLTVTGVGGSGKTRLALQVATSVFDDFRDGVWLVELAPVAEADGVMRAIAASLGIGDQPGRTLAESVKDHLRSRQLLLILDNCEHLLDTVARIAQQLLSAARELTILATSREMLGVSGEVPFQLRSMSFPSPDDPPEVISRFDAVRLFSARAEAVRPGFRVSADNSQAVASLCRRLDGMPLAIELAAARLRMLSPEQIASRLDDRFRLLTGGSRTALPRQQTLQAAIDWSYDLLAQQEKVLFNRLSVFQGGFSLEAVEAVCGQPPLDPGDVLDLLSHLVDKSLVITTDGPDGVRYRTLETLRQYGRERLANSGDVDLMREAHAIYFRELAETALPHLRGTDETLWLDRLEADHDNLRQVLRWSIDSGRAELAQGLAGTLYRFWMIRHHSEEGRDWLQQAVAMEPSGDVSWGRAQLGAGTMALLHGDLGEGRRHLEVALATVRKGDRPDLTSAAIHNLAMAAIRMGDYETGAALIAEEFADAEARHDLQSMAFASQELASLANATGDVEKGGRLLDAAVQFAEKTGSMEMLSNVLTTAFFEALFVDDMERANDYSKRLSELGRIPSAPGRQEIVAALVMGRKGDPERALAKIKKTWGAEFRKLADYRSIAVVMVAVFVEV